MSPVMDLTSKLATTERLNCPTLQRAHRGVALNEREIRERELRRESARLRLLAGLNDIIADELRAENERERSELEGV
tara:strand:+ start:334 stop:564 length:231 start_codon:yes stop_codon:yes gene_type:complete